MMLKIHIQTYAATPKIRNERSSSLPNMQNSFQSLFSEYLILKWLASVNRHDCNLRSRYADVMVSSKLFFMIRQASSCSRSQPALGNDMRLAAAMLRLRLPLRALATKLLSTVEASANKGMSRRIQPTAALNCHT